MKIGLVDYDFIRLPEQYGLSVELMQLASYYESKNQQIFFLDDVKDMKKCDKVIIYAANLTFNLEYYLEVQTLSNVEYIGPIFYNWQSFTISNSEITSQPINTKYYKYILKKFLTEGRIDEKRYSKLINSQWRRIFNPDIISADSLLTGEYFFITDNNFLNKDEIEPLLRKMAIYNKYFYFCNYLLISNTKELERFKKIVEYGFTNVHGCILLETAQDFENFIKDNFDLMDSVKERLAIPCFYNKSNIYNSKDYVNMFIDAIKKVKINYENNRICRDILIRINTGSYLEMSIFNALRVYPQSDNFFQTYMSLYKTDLKITGEFFNFLQRHQELYYWTKLQIGGKRNARFTVFSRDGEQISKIQPISNVKKESSGPLPPYK